MIYLSNAALRYAVNICLESPNYHVVICPEFRSEWGDLIDQIIDYVPSLAENINRVKKTKSNNCFIEFSNGSVILFCPAKENSRGMRANLIIASSKLDKDFIYAVLLPMEIKQFIEKR